MMNGQVVEAEVGSCGVQVEVEYSGVVSME